MCQALLEIMEPEINKIKETVKEEVTKQVTREVTKEVTESVTKEVTESVTKEVTESVTKEVTESVTKQERQKGIRSLVTFLRSSGQEDTEIMNAIIKVYDVSAIEAEGYL